MSQSQTLYVVIDHSVGITSVQYNLDGSSLWDFYTGEIQDYLLNPDEACEIAFYSLKVPADTVIPYLDPHDVEDKAVIDGKQVALYRQNFSRLKEDSDDWCDEDSLV